MLLAQTDPNLFRLDWDRLAEVMMIIIVLAFFLERALALLFETKQYQRLLGGQGLRPWIALGVAGIVRDVGLSIDELERRHLTGRDPSKFIRATD